MDYRDELRCLAHPPLLPQPLDSLPQPYTVPPIFRDKTPAPGQALFRHKKLRYRGLAKNTAQLHTLFALANLVIVKKALLA